MDKKLQACTIASTLILAVTAAQAAGGIVGVNYEKGTLRSSISSEMPAVPDVPAPAATQNLRAAAQQPDPWDGFFRQLSSKVKEGGLVDAGDNTLKLLVDGQAVINSIVPDIKNAKNFIDIEIYQWQPDDTGAMFRDLLAQKMKEGVKVRIILDAYGSDLVKPGTTARSFVDEMKKDGLNVQVRGYEVLHIDHRKIFVMDDGQGGILAYTGGMNIGNDYQRNWHDQLTRINGMAIARMHQSFIDDWEKLTGEELNGFPEPRPENGPHSYVITHVGGDTDQNIKQAYLLAISTARGNIRIEDPYFTDDDVIAALIKAAQRQVKVQVIVPLKDDEQVTLKAFRSHYPDLIKAGVEIYEYQPRMEHLKVAVMDHEFATFGSSNLDSESLKYNDELNLMLVNADFAAQMERSIFDVDIAQSNRITSYKPGITDDIDGHLPFLAPDPDSSK
jgi:cardiolipin synthase